MEVSPHRKSVWLTSENSNTALALEIQRLDQGWFIDSASSYFMEKSEGTNWTKIPIMWKVCQFSEKSKISVFVKFIQIMIALIWIIVDMDLKSVDMRYCEKRDRANQHCLTAKTVCAKYYSPLRNRIHSHQTKLHCLQSDTSAQGDNMSEGTLELILAIWKVHWNHNRPLRWM